MSDRTSIPRYTSRSRVLADVSPSWTKKPNFRNSCLPSRFNIPLGVVLLVLLCVGTVLFSFTVLRYQVAGGNLVRSTWIHAGEGDTRQFPRESARAGNDGLVLENRAHDRIASLSQTIAISPEKRLYILSCEVRARHIVAGKKDWERGRVAIFPLTAAGKPRYDVPHTLVALKGTGGWKRYEQVFFMPEGTNAVSLTMQLVNATGTLEARSCALLPAAENAVYPAWQRALISLWLVGGLWIIAPLVLTAWGKRDRMLLLTLGLVLFAGVLMPAGLKSRLTPTFLLPEQEVAEPFQIDLAPPTIAFDPGLVPHKLDIYKLAHFLLFAAMGWLIAARRPYPGPVWRQACLLVLFALATECLQVFASRRGGSFGDVMIDILGASCGMLIARNAWRRHGNR